MRFVIDASVALCWLIPGQSDARSTGLLQQARNDGAVVPALWHIEIANQLGLKLRQQKLTPDDYKEALVLVADLDIETDQHSRHSAAELVETMNMYRLTAYDAVYLDLAIRRQLPLASFDKELIAAAQTANVPVVTHYPPLGTIQ